LRAGYCNQCGARQDDSRAPKDADGRAKLYADIAHPINSHCREMIQNRVVQEYYEEIERAKQPDYVSRYDDFDFEYADGPRSRTARFDQPHVHPAADQPHVAARRPIAPASDSAPPHLRDSSPGERARAAPGERASGHSFGAGIFPE
jgi:stage V sporulation protein G